MKGVLSTRLYCSSTKTCCRSTSSLYRPLSTAVRPFSTSLPPLNESSTEGHPSQDDVDHTSPANDVDGKDPHEDVPHTASEGLPFIRFRHLLKLKGRKFDAATLFDAIHPSAKTRDRRWPRQYVNDILSRSTHRSTIIRLFPILVNCVRDIEAHHAGRLLQNFNRWLADRRMLAALPAVVDVFLDLVDQVRTGSEKSDQDRHNTIQQIYGACLGSLHPFANPTGWRVGNHFNDNLRSKPLTEPIRREVVRIVQHYVATLDETAFSSSTDRQPRMDDATFDRLFTPRFLSPELRKILLRYAENAGITLSASQWHMCFVSASAEKDSDLARRYLEAKRNCLAVQGPQSAKEDITDDWISPGQRDEVTNLIDRLEPHLTPKRQRKAFVPFGLPMNFDQPKFGRDRMVVEGSSWRKDPTADELSPYAWSKLFTSAAADLSIDADRLVKLADKLPESAVRGHCLTPVIQGLVARRESGMARNLWSRLVELARAERGNEEKYIDNASLSAACQAQRPGLAGFETAIAMVDDYARRRVVNIKPDVYGGVLLDSQTVNVLLLLCKRNGLASVAFRIWAAALPRWNVYLDERSLGLLMETTRTCETVHREKNNEVFTSSLRLLRDESLRLLRDDFRSLLAPGKRVTRYDEYETDGFGKGPVSVLLDAPGSSREKKNDHDPPWRLAREVFREVVLGNWPHLESVQSPLSLESGPMSYVSSFFGGKYTSRSSRDVRACRQMPSENARYTHIIPDAVGFYIYIGLLGFHHLTEEIPVVLAWMKELDMRPTWKTMCWAMMYIAEAEGPSKRVTGWGPNGESALVRDVQIMRRWLVEWLGDGTEIFERKERHVVPTLEDVTILRMGFMSKNARLTA